MQAENNSLYNTPNTFGVYILGLDDEVAEVARRACRDRAAERAQGGDAVRRDRSHRLLSRHRAGRRAVADELTFRLPSEELEKTFDKEATAAGLDGLKGHRSVGGMRASIYNAFPEEGVDGARASSCASSSARTGSAVSAGLISRPV